MVLSIIYTADLFDLWCNHKTDIHTQNLSIQCFLAKHKVLVVPGILYIISFHSESDDIQRRHELYSGRITSRTERASNLLDSEGNKFIYSIVIIIQ